jgi:hypothetical protein
MKLHTLALAALVAVAGQSFAQTSTPTTAPDKATVKADRDAVKADKEKLKQDKKAGASADVIKADQDKLAADKAKAKSDNKARKEAKAGTATPAPSTTGK